MPHEIMTSSNTNCESKPQKPDSDCSAWWTTENYNKSVWFLTLCQINFSVLHETFVVTWWNKRVFRGRREAVVFDHSRLSCCLMFHICGFWRFYSFEESRFDGYEQSAVNVSPISVTISCRVSLTQKPPLCLNFVWADVKAESEELFLYHLVLFSGLNV